MRRWFYIDIREALDPNEDRLTAIVSVPEDRRVKSDFDRTIELDLSSPEREYENLLLPVNQVFDSYEWRNGFFQY